MTSLELFKKLSGQKLRSGDADVMTVYRTGLKLYRDGLANIEQLRSLSIYNSDMDQQRKIINIADATMKKGEEFKRKIS